MFFDRSRFPDKFTFGAATAAYQIEGNAKGNAGQNHWDTFAATPGNVVGAQNGARACDHYTFWQQDLDLMQAAGFDAYRFSTSWPRVQPDGRGAVNPEGLDFYDRLVDGVLDRGMDPFVTLYHWDLPLPLADKGGWCNRDTCAYFADYAEIIMDRIGDRVASTATVNEPWCISYLSHFLGQHAPGLRDIRATARSMHHILLAHGMAMSRLRQAGHDGLGLVLNFEPAQPADETEASARAAATQHAIYNRWFIEAVTLGKYPEEALLGLEPHLPQHWQDDMEIISQPLDFVGVNYYTRSLYEPAAEPAWPGTRSKQGPLKKTQMGWEVYPQGLEDILLWLSAEYVGDLPLYVTENGIALADRLEDGKIHDTERCAYITEHLQATANALSLGANIKGFFYWSLLDNFEWAHGYDKRFGLVHVDFKTLQRVPKFSYYMLQKALTNG